MTVTLRVVVIVASVLTAGMILQKIRQSKLVIEDSIFWLAFSSILILFSLFPGLPNWLGKFHLSDGDFSSDCEAVPYVH